MFKTQWRSLSHITTKVESPGIHSLFLNSKPVNALDPLLMTSLKTELERLHADSSVYIRLTSKGILFGSAFPKVLSAGLDLKTLVAHPKYYIPDADRPAQEKGIST